jgi:hypothetical protein
MWWRDPRANTGGLGALVFIGTSVARAAQQSTVRRVERLRHERQE